MADVDTGLLDASGRPIRRRVTAADLSRPIATSSLSSIRQSWTTQEVAAGLTPQRLASVMRQAAEGDHEQFVILAEEMEERDWHYGAVLAQRKLAVLGLDRTVVAASDSAQDKAIAAECEALIVQDEAFDDLLAGSLDAMGKGWAAVEIAWETRPGKPQVPTSYTWRDPRWFRWDRDTGEQLRLIDEADVAFGIELPKNRFAIHQPKLKMGLPVRGGLARLAAWAFLFKFYSVKDWAAFSETYGQPLRVGKYDAAATAADIDILYRAVGMIGTDCAAVIPKAMEIEFINASAGSSQSGADLYQKFGDFLDRQVSKAVLGQTGTTDMQHGGGLAQAKVLDGVRGDLRESDAKQLARTIRRDVFEPYVRFNYGPDAAAPGLRLATEPPEDLEQFAAGVTPFVDRGFKVPVKAIYAKFSLQPPEPGEEVLQPTAASPATLQLPAPDKTAANRAGCPVHGHARNREGASADGDAYAGMIEALSDPLNEGWEPAMDALIEPIAQLADRVGSYAEFQAELDAAAAEMDPRVLAKSLAAALFKARGVGDATDRPDP